jgi:hypothetical protein
MSSSLRDSGDFAGQVHHQMRSSSVDPGNDAFYSFILLA